MTFRDDVFRNYIDPEETLRNYETDLIIDNHIIDINHTGMSYYDTFLNNQESKCLSEEHSKSEIILMTPEEYYQECSRICWGGKATVAELKYERGTIDYKIIENLKTVVQQYKRKLCLPVIDYTLPTQEGLHRMFVVGELLGWNHRVPVLKVESIDKQ